MRLCLLIVLTIPTIASAQFVITDGSGFVITEPPPAAPHSSVTLDGLSTERPALKQPECLAASTQSYSRGRGRLFGRWR